MGVVEVWCIRGLSLGQFSSGFKSGFSGFRVQVLDNLRGGVYGVGDGSVPFSSGSITSASGRSSAGIFSCGCVLFRGECLGLRVFSRDWEWGGGEVPVMTWLMGSVRQGHVLPLVS